MVLGLEKTFISTELPHPQKAQFVQTQGTDEGRGN